MLLRGRMARPFRFLPFLFVPMSVCLGSFVACSSGSSLPDAVDAASPPPSPTSPKSDGATPDAAADAELPPPPGDRDGGDDAGDATYCAYRTGTCKQTPARCVAERACFAGLRATVGAGIEACVVASNQCKSVDTCMAAEGAKHAEVPAVKTFAPSCAAKRTACGGAFPFSDDTCAMIGIFADASLAAFTTCLALPCPDAATCIEAELARIGCGET